MKALYLSFLFIIWAPSLVLAQQESEADSTEEEVWIKPELNPARKAGIRLGTGMASMIGPESKTSSFFWMFSGGAYYKYRFNKVWFIQPELGITSKGSNFDNKTGEYGQIRCYMIEAPVLLMRGLNANNTSLVFAGVGYAYLLNASLYKVNESLANTTDPGINKHDVFLAAGAQFHTPFVGFQLIAKYGLLNANKGLDPTLPPANTGKNLNHLSVELHFIF